MTARSVIMEPVGDLNSRIDELADLMDEFGLERAVLKGGDWSVAFDRNPPSNNGQAAEAAAAHGAQQKTPPTPETPEGTPVTSPMTGIYYNAPSPGAPMFVSPGDMVGAGQVVGLIEAMKVFNEITAPAAGTVTGVMFESGQLVQPGDALIYIA